MGKFDGFLFCSDYDGTLADYKGNIPQNNLDAIKYFQENGGIFTVVTGRACEYLLDISKKLEPKTHVIACNGAVLFDWKKKEVMESVYVEQFDDSICDFFFDKLNQCNSFASVGIDNVISLYAKDDYKRYDWGVDVKKVTCAKDIKEDIKKTSEKIQRFFVMQKAKDTEAVNSALIKEYGEKYQILRSWSEGIEILPLNVSKGSMVKSLIKREGLNIHSIVCAGDFFNDISMFEIADYSFAAKNAPKEVKKHAQMSNVFCEDGIISFAVKHLAELI